MKIRTLLSRYNMNCSLCLSNIISKELKFKFSNDVTKVFSSVFFSVSHNQTKNEEQNIKEFRPILKISRLVYSPTHRITANTFNSVYEINKPIGWNYPSRFIHVRNFTSGNSVLQNDENVSNIQKPDNINIGKGTWKEVYSGVLTTQLKLLKMFSIGSSIIGLSMQSVLYEKLGTADLTIVLTLASFLGFFTFVTPALIHWVSKKYVTKLEYDPRNDVYAATTLSFFLREKKIHFKIDDVSRPEIPGLFTSFLVKNKALFVDPETFEDVGHYSRIMGYDKPIDFSWERDRKRR